MYDLKDLTSQNFQLIYEYVGEVIDNKDPEYRGRLKCKIFGITENTNSDELPWCETMGELFGSNKGTASFSATPNLGTLVYIKFLYGNPSYPVVSGYVRGNKDSSNLHKVANLGESIFNTRNTRLIGPELSPLNTSANYPDNNVIETETAVIEIDDTSGNERISIQHKNGSYYEIRPNGTIQIKSVKDEYHIITGNVEEYIQQCVNSIIKGNKIQAISGMFDITVDGNLQINNHVKINGNLRVNGKITTTEDIHSLADIGTPSVSINNIKKMYDSHLHPTTDGATALPPVSLTGTNNPIDVTLSPVGCSAPDVFIPIKPADTPESYYTPNIQPRLSSSEVPESYPTNPEQVEKTDKQVVASTGDCASLTHKNPFEVANELLSLGTKAWQETGSNPNIKALWDEIGYNGSRFADQTAWCAVFVSAVLKRSGNKYLKTASSQAYKNYGEEVHIRDIKCGDLVVFYRKGKNSGQGHVGFATGKYTDTHIMVLGGNQSDNLNIRSFKRLDKNKGWGITSIRRAVKCSDGTTPPPDYSYTPNGTIYDGGKVV